MVGRMFRGFMVLLAILIFAGIGLVVYFGDPEIRDIELTEKYGKPPSQFIKLPSGGNVHFRDQGQRNGPAIVLLLPGEAYVEYQILAQALRPDAMVMTIGYGESATGYIPTSLQLAEGDENLGDWYWVSDSAETVLTEGLERALGVSAGPATG